MQKIIIIICFFGELPWYFKYFLHSCKYNSTINFRLITDIPLTDNLPKNLLVVQKSIEEIKNIASSKLGFDVNIEFAYKLCDYKPAYGFLFPELVEEYDFWGQSDIDVIYGDLRNFLTENMLKQFDYISVRHDWTTGCFSLFRNNHTMNNLFKQSKDYQKVFSSSRHFCFDECNFKQDLLTAGKSIFELDREIDCFTYLIKQAEQKNEIKPYFDFILIEGIPGKIKFDKGKIIYKRRFEAILYHLYWLKKVYSPKKIPDTIPETFYVSPTRIYT